MDPEREKLPTLMLELNRAEVESLSARESLKAVSGCSARSERLRRKLADPDQVTLL
jgi:hypothetical protein